MAGDMTDGEFASKVDWEGGLYEATMGYGLSAEDLKDTEGELYKAMKSYDEWVRSGHTVRSAVEFLLAEALNDYDEEDY